MSKPYLISYDLMKPGQDYSGLIAALERLGAQRVLLSVWALNSPNSPVELRDHLRQFMDSNDRLLVAEFSMTNWASWKTLINLNNLAYQYT